MADGISSSNIDSVIDNINREISKIESKSQVGITAAATFVRTEAQKRTPVDTGNLRNSAYVAAPGRGGAIRVVESRKFTDAGALLRHIQEVRRLGTGGSVTTNVMYAEIGFTAAYAVFVHEIDKNYTVGGWKYLERALAENTTTILRIIRSGVILK